MPKLLEVLKEDLINTFDETFEQVKGIYLDRGTSLFETLDGISAEVASRPVSANCASIAAQTDHIRFYIDHLEQYLLGNDPGKADWGEIWRTVEQVTPEEWDAIKSRLKASYQRIRVLVSSFETWEEEGRLSDMLAIVVHTAYHLGEIRQALCTVQRS